MRVLVMGTGGFAVPTFRWLLTSEHDVIALVTRPPRGRKPPANPMQTVAVTEASGLPVLMPDRIKSDEASAALRDLPCDLYVVCDYGQILPAAALEIPRLGGINLHASLLPAYRGAAPINWAMYDGCRETGVTVIHMTPKLDAGPCLVKTVVPIDPTETAEALEERLATIGVDLVRQAIEMLETWDGRSEIGEPQDSTFATRAPRLKKSDGEIRFERSAQQIVDHFRAFQPWPGLFTHWLRPDGKPPLRLKITALAVSDVDTSSVEPGQVISVDKQLLLATGDGVLDIQHLQPAGKRSMLAVEFLRGQAVAVGDFFGSATPG